MTKFLSTVALVDVHMRETEREFLQKSIAPGTHLKAVIFTDGAVADTQTAVLLGKIMAALKLSDTDYLVIDKERYPGIRYRHLPKGDIPILVFGLHPAEIGLQFALHTYEVVVHGTAKFLLADSLEAIGQKEPLKKKLWGALQQMFLP